MSQQIDVERGEQTPLLDETAAAGASGTAAEDAGAAAPTMKGIKEDVMESESLKEKAVTGIAGFGFISSIISMILQAAHPSVLVAGVFGLVLSPYAAFQQRKITQVEALKETNEEFEREVGFLQNENVRLETEVTNMSESVEHLDKIRETFNVINALEGDSVKKLEEQVNESRQILNSMNMNYKGVILQNLISVILASDENMDMLLSDEEIDELITNLEGIHNVNIKNELLRQTIIDNGRSVNAVMEVARNVINTHIPTKSSPKSKKGDQEKAEEDENSLFTFLEEI